MSNWYAKTDAGRTEIKTRLLRLSRPARNLLLIIDESKSAEDWILLVHGATGAELQSLVDFGLIELRDSPAYAAPSRRKGAKVTAPTVLTYGQMGGRLARQERDAGHEPTGPHVKLHAGSLGAAIVATAAGDMPAARIDAAQLREAVLEKAQKLLAEHIGPIARVVVKRAAEQTCVRGPFFKIVSEAVPAGAQRQKLLGELAKLA